MKPEQCERAISVLRSRDGLLTIITLADGRVLKTFNIAWGRDLGDDFDHITTNISPPNDATTVDVFHTSEIMRMTDEEGAVLFGTSN